MKTKVRKYFILDSNGGVFYLWPCIRFEYNKDAFFNGRQFIITFAILFWEIDIEFNEH